MDKPKENKVNASWILFALCTVVCWGLYGGLLNWGAIGFEHNRMKAFLFVGLAYFLVAVIGPVVYIAVEGKGWDFHPQGIKWSLIAGIAGAVGAFTLLFALNLHPLTADKKPALAASQVMSLIFAGAPIIAAGFAIAVSLSNRKPGVDFSINPMFILGLVLAAAGGALVTLFKP